MGSVPAGADWAGAGRRRRAGAAASALFTFALATALGLLGVPGDARATVAGTKSSAPKSAALAEEVPRHPLEMRGLVDPEGVLAELPQRLRDAVAAKDFRELALLEVSRANACRVLANWPCQRDAGAAARQAAARAGWPLMEVRGIMAEARARISMQDFSGGEQLLAQADHILASHPSPELAADIHLAYSSMSYMLGKPDVAADYAARGLHKLGLRPALPIRVRLLRNQANALTQLGRPEEARAVVKKGIALLKDLDDPKLSAEMYLEDARIAYATEDNPEQVASGARVLELAGKLGNNQLVGLGHEALALAARQRKDRATALDEFELARASFRALGLDRDERRVLRAILGEHLAEGRTPDLAFAQRLLFLEESLDDSDYQLAGDDFEARMKYEQQAFEVQRLQAAAELAAQRERTLTYQRRFAVAIATAALVLVVLMGWFAFAQRRWGERLQAAFTRLRESERMVERSAVRMRAITDNMPALIAHLDREERYLFVNAMGANIFGIHPRDMIGRTVREVRGDTIYAVMQPHIQAALRGETVSFEGESDVGGVRYHYQSSFVPDYDSDGEVQGLYALTFDISRLKQAEEALERLARIDPLTGVANRRQFEEQLSVTLSRSRRQDEGVALLMIDIDRFKTLNDAHGHPAGDAVLATVANRLQQCVRAEDLVARLGGDEFVVLVGHALDDAGETVARKLQEAMLEPIEFGNLSLAVRTSIGVGFSPGPITPAKLMALADRALYRAKADGRNTFHSARADDVPA